EASGGGGRRLRGTNSGLAERGGVRRWWRNLETRGCSAGGLSLGGRKICPGVRGGWSERDGNQRGWIAVGANRRRESERGWFCRRAGMGGGSERLGGAFFGSHPAADRKLGAAWFPSAIRARRSQRVRLPSAPRAGLPAQASRRRCGPAGNIA